MTKQGQLEEWIAGYFCKFDGNDGKSWVRYTGHANDILKHIQSQGGALKVERELPSQRWDEFIEHDWVDFTPTEMTIMKGMLKWHKDSLEPLVKEE